MSTVRSVGVEEELLLVDPRTRGATSRAPEVLKGHRDRHGAATAATEAIDRELFRHQIEIQTEPVQGAEELLRQVRSARRTVGEAVSAAGLALAAVAVPPLGSDPQVTADDRYLEMVDTFGTVARDAGTCGMHVHVDIASDEEGVRVVDAIAPWLPVLLAISANSPIARGQDTGYASWRSQEWSRWPSSGPGQPFGSVEEYHRVSRILIASGAARDAGMLYYDARLSEHYPTVEIRVCDVVTDPHDTVLLAVLARAMVETAARETAPRADTADRPAWRVEMLRAARWRASRYGVSGTLLDPLTQQARPASQVLRELTRRLAPALTDSGDTEFADDGVGRVLAGTGASRQRAAMERTGTVEGVVDDLVVRTTASWEDAG